MNNEIEIYVVNAKSESKHAWIDATLKPEEMQREIDAKLKKNEDDTPVEFRIMNSNGFGTYISTYENLKTVHEIAEFVRKCPSFGSGLINHYGNCFVKNAQETAKNGYLGEYTTIEECFTQLIDDMEDIPKYIERHINYTSLADEFEQDYIIITDTNLNTIHVFTDMLENNTSKRRQCNE